jgi:hypothetical protein
VLPQAGDNVTLNGNWTVLLDVDPAPLDFLVIDGILYADDTRDVNITANAIHVRAGNVTTGTAGRAFHKRFIIQINGKKNDSGFTIDPSFSGNKFLVVTGSLSLQGKPPATASTVLTQTAPAGSNLVWVGSSLDWAVGDQLVLSSSFSSRTEHERVTIQSLNAEGSVTLTANLQFTHYGASSITINNTFGTLDTRTRVGHLSRNIKIVAGPDAGWGFSLLVYGYLDTTYNLTRIGSVALNGVQFTNGGQFDTLNAPLVFLNAQNGNFSSSVTASTFADCQASCLYVKNSNNITFTNNLLYNSYVFGAQVHSTQNLTFERNLIIGVSSKPTLTAGAELVACLYVVQNPDNSSMVSYKENYCLGSEQHGFALPFIACGSPENNPFANNTVGSARIGFILNTNGQQCQAFSYAKAFACDIGQICGPPSITTIKLERFIMADNIRSVTLKLGASEGGDNHTAFLSNSYITAISRPNCTQCYGPSAITCSNTHGMRMLTASANGEVLPAKFGPGFDVICKQPVYDSKSFLTNVVFDSFRQNYSESALTNCGNNFAFKPHSSAFDMVGGVNLFSSQCTNCDSNSYLKAPVPDPTQLGWFGGCGDLLCTGFQNYLVQDHDGSFFGVRGTIIANNSAVGAGETGCSFSAPMNAYYCSRSDFAVLEYQSVAADFKTRIMWPVTLTYQGASYSTITNGWREWDWLGSEPLNHRFGRFVSVVRLNQTYNMTFASMAPEKLQLQLQKKSLQGNNSNYIIVKLYYPKPNSIRLELNGTEVDPMLVTDTAASTLNTSKCGANAYYSTNYTIIFVITEAADCLVTVYLSETVQLTTHFAMNASDFFSNSSLQTNFIDRLSAVLGITDKSRVKIVGVYQGSLTLVTHIFPSKVAGAAPLSQVSQTLSNQIASGNLSSTMSSSGMGSMIGASSTYFAASSASTTNDSNEDSLSTGAIIGIAVGGANVAIILVVIVICVWRRNNLPSDETANPGDVEIAEKGDRSVNNTTAKPILRENETHSPYNSKLSPQPWSGSGLKEM